MSNLAAVLYGKEDVRIDEQPLREPCKGEVRLRVSKVGLCGSDVYMFMNGTHGTHEISEPGVIGHEACAVVEKVGEGVTNLKVGDRVALEPGDACGECKNCLKGSHNMCLVERPFDGADFEGYLIQSKIMKASYCHKLPDHLTDEEGSFMEPLAVAVHDCRRGMVQAGTSVLVLGAGTIGLLCMMTAKAMGAKSVCITDVVQSKLDLAKTLGADYTLLTSSPDVNKLASQIEELMGGAPDVTLECTGNNMCQRLAIMATIPDGIVVLIGYGQTDVTLPMAIANQRQINIRPSWRYDRFCYPIAIDLVASGRVKVAPLVSHRYPLQQTTDAIKMAASRQQGVQKVVIDLTS